MDKSLNNNEIDINAPVSGIHPGQTRTRFAPSPTGYMHIGNLRTALFAYLIAKNKGGAFLLRIEDTDLERYVDGAVEVIYDTLRDTGLNWDEGPDIGGPVGPYVQSERMGMFRKYAEKLVEMGHAYYCFCTKDRLDELRRIQQASHIAPMYDRHCRELSPDEVKKNLEAGLPYVIRQKVPFTGTTTFHDEIYGDITVENATLDDQVLIKTDGMPTYNFANVVDDHTMGITHVVRGNEYLASTPKYNLLYEAFGWTPPVYVHVEHIMKNATEKLSKRNGDASYQDLLEKGFIKEAVVNYIALLGWSPKGENEIFSLSELEKIFDISGIAKSPAVFDPVKLRAINAAYIRRMSISQFMDAALPYIKQVVTREDVDFELLCTVLQPRTELYTDIPPQVDFLDALPDYELELFTSKKMKTDPAISLDVLNEALPVLEALADDQWTVEAVNSALLAIVERRGVKNGLVLWPIRVALSGKSFTPGGAIELAVILGRNDALSRIKTAIKRLSESI